MCLRRNLMAQFAIRLAVQKNKRGLTDAGLASISGLTLRRLADLRRGQHMPSDLELGALCVALDLPRRALMPGSAAKPTPLPASVPRRQRRRSVA